MFTILSNKAFFTILLKVRGIIFATAVCNRCTNHILRFYVNTNINHSGGGGSRYRNTLYKTKALHKASQFMISRL